MSFLLARPPSGLFYFPGNVLGGEEVLLFLLFGFAFHSLQADTANTYRQPEVIVTATRTPISSLEAPSRVTRIDVDQLQNDGMDDIRNALSFVDGIFVKNYGPTQIATISLRGTTADQTLFLFDGLSLNNVQNGLVDLFLVPTSSLSSIEISQGGSSALYGANAVGGVVSLVSREASDNLVRVDLENGSYGNQMAGAEVSEGLGSVRLSLTLQRERGANNFDFTFDDGEKNFAMKMVGADYLKDEQSLKIAFPTSGGSTSFLIQNLSADRGTPYGITDSASVGTAREKDNSTLAILKNSGTIGIFNYSASTGLIYSYLRYTDPSYAEDDYYKMLSLQPGTQLSYSGDQVSGATGLDAEFDRGESDKMIGTKDRNRIGAFMTGEYDFGKNSDPETHLFGALRYDDYSQFGSSFNPKFGINIKPLAQLPFRVRANAGTSFRVPTFDDLYYSDPYYTGNVNLKPERSTDYDLGGIVEIGGNQLPARGDLDVDYYHIDTRDGIALLQLPDGSSTERNLQRVMSKGIELSLHLDYASLVSLTGNYFFGKSLDVSDPSDPTTYEKQLIYIPQEQSSISAELTPWIFNFTAAVRYVGERFYTSDNTASVSPYAVTFLSVSARIDAGSFRIRPRVSIDDLFNREYVVIPDYPMPARTYQLGVSFEFNQD